MTPGQRIDSWVPGTDPYPRSAEQSLLGNNIIIVAIVVPVVVGLILFGICIRCMCFKRRWETEEPRGQFFNVRKRWRERRKAPGVEAPAQGLDGGAQRWAV